MLWPHRMRSEQWLHAGAHASWLEIEALFFAIARDLGTQGMCQSGAPAGSSAGWMEKFI